MHQACRHHPFAKLSAGANSQLFIRHADLEQQTDSFVIKDGGNTKDTYAPKKGDIIANLDKNISLIAPILEHVETSTIYRHNSSVQTGMILRVK